MAFRLFLLLGGIAALLAPIEEKSNLATAKDYFFSRRLDAAQETLRAMITADPGNLPARYLLVRSLIESNQPEAALKEAQVAAERAPSEAVASVALGDARFRLGEFEAALAAYREALRLNPRHPRAALGVGRVLLSDFRFKSAKEYFTTALALDPRDADIALAMSSVMVRSAAQLALEDQFVSAATYRDREELDGTKAFISLFSLKHSAQPFVPLNRPEAATVKLEAVPPYTTLPTAFLLPLSINNGEPRKLLLDTGAHGVLISSRLAQLDGIESQVPYRLGGLGGKGRLPSSLGWADTFKIGEIRLGGGPVIVTETPVAPMWEGIIGTDVLRDFLLTFDFPNNSLRIEKHSESGAEPYSWDRASEARPGFTLLRLAEGKLLVPATINGRTISHFILDTGAARNLIDRKLGQSISKLTSTRRKIQGVSGQVEEVLKSEELVLDFGGIRHRESLMAVDLSEVSYALGVEVGGVIGCSVLRDLCVTVDYHNGMARFQREAKP